MKDPLEPKSQVQYVTSFEELVTTPFSGKVNALCWKRELKGDFAEIVSKIEFDGKMTELQPRQLEKLFLTEQGQIAREFLLKDFYLLKEHAACPVLNVIGNYESDTSTFPTDVYSWHVDRSPVPTDTFLCTYYGASSEILPNGHAEQKVRVPEILNELKKIYNGPEEGFDVFLSENFFDLHYLSKPNAPIICAGLGHMWKLATDHPGKKVLPCIHRAPKERAGEKRLLLIC